MSCKDQFLLSSLESKIDKTNEVQAERLSHIKSQIIEKQKTTKQRHDDSKRRLLKIKVDLIKAERDIPIFKFAIMQSNGLLSWITT